MAKVIVIPARYASRRFPGKLLRDDSGWPLIRHVVERCCSVRGVDRIVVAADGERIAAAVREFGGDVVLTDPDLPSGTDRVAQAVAALELGGEDSLIVNVQGDEPTIDPAHVELLFRLLEESGADVATLASPRTMTNEGRERWYDPNQVKVVCDQRGRALYFSRAPIPCVREEPEGKTWLAHIGIYGFRPHALELFAKTQPTALEKSERLEQLRYLELGMQIQVGLVDNAEKGIDTPEDYAKFLETHARK